MAKFRCIHSGNVFVFESQHDINDLRKHPEYVEVIEQDKVQSVGISEQLPTVRKAGRPAKPKE